MIILFNSPGFGHYIGSIFPKNAAFQNLIFYARLSKGKAALF